MRDRDYIEIKKLYDTFLKTPGSFRLTSEEEFKEAIIKGVSKGIFGYGELIDGKIENTIIKKPPYVELSDEEIIIKPELCKIKEEKEKEVGKEIEEDIWEKSPNEPQIKRTHQVEPKITPREEKTEAVKTPFTEEIIPEKINDNNITEKYRNITLKFITPVGNTRYISKIANYLNSKFEDCEIEVTIRAKNGEISKSDYEDKVLEALKQENIKILDNNIK